MTRVHISVPKHLCGRPIPVPSDLKKQVHAKEPKHLAIHRMLGYDEQEEGRVVWCRMNGDMPQITVTDGDGERRLDLPRVRAVAALAYLESYVLNDTLIRIKSFDGQAEVVTKGIIDSAMIKILNGWSGEADADPWSGVGIIAVSPDGQEFGFVRKDHLHPVMGYSCRLAVVGGGMDRNEVLSAWGRDHECARVSMWRECFEEIRDLRIATEIAEACEYYGPSRANCYLFEDDGRATQGHLRLFVVQAPTSEAWDCWRRLYNKETDLLGEANPEILTRDQLIKALAADGQAARARKEFLKTASPDALREAEADLLARFSRRTITNRLMAGRTKLTEDEQKEFTAQVDKIWRTNRDEAFANGEFPLRHRGDFAFIAGMAGPVAHVLKGAHIID